MKEKETKESYETDDEKHEAFSIGPPTVLLELALPEGLSCVHRIESCDRRIESCDYCVMSCLVILVLSFQSCDYHVTMMYMYIMILHVYM